VGGDGARSGTGGQAREPGPRLRRSANAACWQVWLPPFLLRGEAAIPCFSRLSPRLSHLERPRLQHAEGKSLPGAWWAVRASNPRPWD